MQGFNAVAYVGGEMKPEYRKPINCDKIVKSWTATRERAVEEKRKLEAEYDNAVVELQ